MWLANYLRNQNYGWIMFNKNNPTWIWWWGVQWPYWDEEYKDMSPIEAVAKSIGTMREQTKKRNNDQVISDLLNSQNTMFWQAVSSRNKATSKEEMKAAQLDAFAAIVKWRWDEDYPWEWDEYNTTKDIIWHYIELNNSPEVNKRLVQYSQSQENPYDFALSMWVLLSPEEKKIRQAQSDLDLLLWEWNTPKWLAKAYNFLWNEVWWGLSSWTDPMQKWDYNELFSSSTSDEAPIVWAIENYAYKTFWKHLNNLDEYEMNKILIDLHDMDTLKNNLPDKATAFANKREWWVYGVAESMFPVATLALEWISAVPVVWDVTNRTLSTIARWIWQVIWSTIWLPETLSLEDQEERFMWYESLWLFSMMISPMFKNNKWWKWNRWTTNEITTYIKTDLWKALKEDWTVDVKAIPEESMIWKIFSSLKERRQNKLKLKEENTRNKMYDKANKILVEPEVWENKQATDAITQLDKEAIERVRKSKNKSEALIKEFDRISKVYENAENAIANTIEKMYWLDSAYEDPISTEAWGKKYTSNKPRKYVQEWIDIMKEIAEYQEEQQYIDLAEQIARDWNLNPYNILEMARSLSKQFDLWSKWEEWPEISKMKSRIDSVRQWLKNMLKRELDKTPEWQELWVNPLEYYDSLWSPVIWTRANISKLRSAWNKAKSRIRDKTVLNKLWTWADKIPFSKAKAARNLLDDIKWENMMSMITKEKEIGKVLKAIKELEQKLPKDQTKAQIEAIMKDWAEKHPWAVEVIEWAIEWEVIEPEWWKWTKWRNPYLEEMFDTVDIEDPNLYLWEDAKYNWQSPIDYTNKTAVTPEGYPWRPWKTTESYKWQPKWEWWTPEKWNKTKVEEVAEQKAQEKIEPNSWQEKANKYLERFWMTLEQWKKQLEAAWIKPEDADRLIEKLAKKNFKTSSKQPTIFDGLWDSNPK